MPKEISTHPETIIYQGNNGEILLRQDTSNDTAWASQSQIADIFGVGTQAITKHIKNIYSEGELDKNGTCSILEQVQSEGSRKVSRKVLYYNLDLLIAVGYRINGVIGTKFRHWANGILKQYITDGIAVNTSLLEQNTEKFQQALEYLNALSNENISKLESGEILTLIQSYASTWLSLDAFDKQSFPEEGLTHSEVSISADELSSSIQSLKGELIAKGEATELFAQEKVSGSISGIVGNVFQTYAGTDVYPSLEEKAANLLYFVVKNHVFTDGNKRSGAFSFVWFLQKSNYQHLSRISPETLTTLTLLIAESDPKEKEKIVGLILLLLK